MPGGVVDEPDPQIVAAARKGDIAAFETLVRRYQGDVWRLVRHLLHDRSSADDVTQEVFLRAYRFLPRYRGESKFSTWLFSIARNSVVDELRRTSRRKRLTDTLGGERAPAHGEPSIAIEIREALAELPMELREPVVLIDIFGMAYSEVASVLGVPEGTIKSRMHRARELLADSLRPGSEEGSRDG
jgi:RNA polymerase sigma-70 factor (ECF subfamily)